MFCPARFITIAYRLFQVCDGVGARDAISMKIWEEFLGETLERHWASMARKVRFPEDELASITRELFDPMVDIIKRVVSSLPAGFPASVAEPVFNGMLAARSRFG